MSGTLTSTTLAIAISNRMSPTISGATVPLTSAETPDCGPPRKFDATNSSIFDTFYCVN
jgi:hypothetical protein